MKQNQKIALMVVGILATAGIWSSVQALTVEEKEAKVKAFQVRATERRENIAEKKGEMETKRDETKMRIEEKKGEMQEKREEKREKRQERFQKISDQVVIKINNIVDRLEEDGIDVSVIESYLTELETRNALVEIATAALDSAYDIEDEDAIEEAQEDVKTAVKSLRDYYHETLRPAIKTAVEEARS